jgi:UrcA family protein
MLKAIPAAMLIASALLSTTAANAATGTSLAVGYGDLDLSTDDGQGDLQRRIAFAAGAVCEYGQFSDITRMSIGKACRSGAIAGAQPAFEEAVANARHGTVTVLGASSLIVTAK